MGSSSKVLARIAERVSALCGGFPHHLSTFESAGLFTGPSLYFHHKTLARRAAHADLSNLFDDDQFFDFLYATLTAWGLHRMGPGNTKLRDIESIKISFKSQAESIREFAGLTLGTYAERDVPNVARELWRLLASLEVSVAEAKIVANSKALHHVLPNLVPPIDREYTFQFFYDRSNLSIEEGGSVPGDVLAARSHRSREPGRNRRACRPWLAHGPRQGR